MKGNPVLYKTLVIGITIFFIGMSVVSSTGNYVETLSSEQEQLEVVENSKSDFNEVFEAYAHVSGGGDWGLHGFDLDDPGDLTFISGTWFHIINCACFIPPCYIYAIEYHNGIIWVFNILTLDIYPIGAGGPITGMDYDDESGCLYYIEGNVLYKRDLETGEYTYIGNTSHYMSGIAIDNGICYGYNYLNDAIYIIDLDTAELTLVGYAGLNNGYVLDMAFDKDNDTLYLAAYISSGALYICNTINGNCTLVGNFEGGWEIDSLAIPYEDTTPPVSTHTLDPLEPDGCNGWYVSDVTVTLTATDDISGVKEIRYTVNGESEQVIHGDNGSFIMDIDGENIFVEFWAIDYAGNVERIKNFFTVDIDQMPPDTTLCYDIVGGNWLFGWDYEYFFLATDAMSGRNVTYYRIDGGEWEIYTGGYFTLPDGDDILIEYYSVDNAGNVEDVNSENISDYCIVNVVLKIPRNKATYIPFFYWFLARFPLLERLLNLIKFI